MMTVEDVCLHNLLHALCNIEIISLKLDTRNFKMVGSSNRLKCEILCLKKLENCMLDGKACLLAVILILTAIKT